MLELGTLEELYERASNGEVLHECYELRMRTPQAKEIRYLRALYFEARSNGDGATILALLDDKEIRLSINDQVDTLLNCWKEMMGHGKEHVLTGGSSDISTWKGVTTDKEGFVTILDWSKRGLSGSVSANIGLLSRLKSLKLK